MVKPGDAEYEKVLNAKIDELSDRLNKIMAALTPEQAKGTQLVQYDVMRMCAHSMTKYTHENDAIYFSLSELGQLVEMLVNYWDMSNLFIPGLPVVATRCDEADWFYMVEWSGFDLNAMYVTYTWPVMKAKWNIIVAESLMPLRTVMGHLFAAGMRGEIPIDERVLQPLIMN